MTRLLHPPERSRERDPAPFDPVAEGARHRLSAELSRAIWERICGETDDHSGRPDEAQARRRFHELATRLAARGGRLLPDIGRVTRVETERDDVARDDRSDPVLSPRAPGRGTLVASEARPRGSSAATIAAHRGEPGAATIAGPRGEPGAATIAAHRGEPGAATIAAHRGEPGAATFAAHRGEAGA